jgi:hypothetical protein
LVVFFIQNIDEIVWVGLHPPQKNEVQQRRGFSGFAGVGWKKPDWSNLTRAGRKGLHRHVSSAQRKGLRAERARRNMLKVPGYY